jgi:ricin-type beta-trefoil lectin protein
MNGLGQRTAVSAGIGAAVLAGSVAATPAAASATGVASVAAVSPVASAAGGGNVAAVSPVALAAGGGGVAARSSVVAGTARGPAELLGVAFQVININSGKCLTVVGGAVADNAGLAQKACTSEPSFRWRFIPVSFTGLFLIQNVRSGKCLTIAADGLADNAFAVQKTCDRAPARHWQLRKSPGVPDNVPNSDAQLVNARSEKCLTVAGGGITENALAVQYTCDAHRSRRWTVRIIAGPLLS